MEKHKVEKLIILGAGPAGLTAALYAARAELYPLVLTGMELGGQASLTSNIENYPGFPEGISGAEIGTLFQKQAERFGARIELESATKINLEKRPFEVKTFGNTYYAESLIIATGASPVHLNIPGEKEYIGQGVSYCATCDGWFFKGKKVIVVGGGDSALEEAIFLTRFAKEVIIVHRRDTFRAGAILQSRVKENEKISIIYDSVLKEISEHEAMKKVVLSNVKTGKLSEMDVDGIFIFIGHSPNTNLFEGKLALDEKGYIKVDFKMQTSVEGVYAAGEVADPDYKQVVTSAGMGAAAAIMAARYLEQKK